MKTDKPEVAHYELQDLWPIALIFVFLGVAIPYGMSIQSEQKDEFGTSACSVRTDGFTNYNASNNMCYNSTLFTRDPQTVEYNSTVDSQKAVAKIPAKSVTIVGIVLAVVVLTVLGRMMYLRSK